MRNENLFLRDYQKDQIKKDLRELLKRSKHDGKEKRLEIADEMKREILPRLDDPKIDISEADGDIIKDSLSVYRDIQAYDLMVRQASKTFLASACRALAKSNLFANRDFKIWHFEGVFHFGQDK